MAKKGKFKHDAEVKQNVKKIVHKGNPSDRFEVLKFVANKVSPYKLDLLQAAIPKRR